MARFTPIRLTENDRKEFSKLAKNSKAKINRTFKNYGINLSNDISIPDIESFQTRKQFNEWKEQASSFTNRNNLRYQFVKNDFGVVATKSEINKIKKDTKKAQRVAETILKESEMKPIIQNGKVVATQGQERLMMGGRNKGISVPNDFDFSKVRSKSRLKEVAENMEKKAKGQFYRDRSKKMQDTFIRELEEAFNSDANDLIEKLKQLDPEEFLDMYNMYESFDFPNFYLMEYVDDSVQNMYLRKMETDVERYINGVDPSLKGF